MKPVIHVAIAVVLRGSEVLICQRKAGDTLGGYWEFPGGKQEPGESLESCLAREMREELAISVRILHRLTTIEHQYPSARIHLHPFLCTLSDGEPVALECDDFRWVTPPSLAEFRFPPANESLLQEIIHTVAAGPIG